MTRLEKNKAAQEMIGKIINTLTNIRINELDEMDDAELDELLDGFDYIYNEVL